MCWLVKDPLKHHAGWVLLHVALKYSASNRISLISSKEDIRPKLILYHQQADAGAFGQQSDGDAIQW